MADSHKRTYRLIQCELCGAKFGAYSVGGSFPRFCSTACKSKHNVEIARTFINYHGFPPEWIN